MSLLPSERPGEGVGRDVAAALAQASDEQLESSIVSLKATIDAEEAELALRVAEYDRRRVADRRHVLSTKQWLRSRLRLSASAASTVLRFGRSLATMVDLREAALSGSVPSTSARTLTAVRERHRDAFGEHGGVLVEAATHLSTRDLRRAVDHWEQHVAPEVVVEDVQGRFARRRMSINQTFDGMWSINGDLDPESGHVVDTTVRALADPGNLSPEDGRSAKQRRADALTEVCRFWLDHNETVVTSAGVKPHITVTVDYDRLTTDLHADHRADSTGSSDAGPAGGEHRPDRGVSGVDGANVLGGVLPKIDGTPVTAEDVRRLACDSDIVRMVTRATSEVLDVGRSTRTIPSAIRRALEHRDRGCTWDGCDAPASWCDAHHVVHWARGGPTSLPNLRLLCRRHHRVTHDDLASSWRAGRRHPPDR
jgi:hypothetical protein